MPDNTPQGKDPDPPKSRQPQLKFGRSKLLFLLVIIGVSIALATGMRGQIMRRTQVLQDWGEFKSLVEAGDVTELRHAGRTFYGTYAETAPNAKKYKGFKITAPNPLSDVHYAWLDEQVKKHKIKLTYSEPSVWTALFISLLPWILIFGFIYFFWIRAAKMGSGGQGGVLGFGKSRHKLITHDKIKKSFVDVAGIEEAKEEVQEIVSFLKNPKRFQRLGGRLPKGVLLIGRPGTGKTLLAKAIAGEADVPFFSISGSDFVEMFVGVGASRVRDLFKEARENSPCIIFFDEIDAVGRRRGAGLGGGHDEREQTLNEILVQMDGMESDSTIIIMASTNRPDILDPALRRPGRFDRQVYVDLPDIRGREQILRIHARKVKMGKDVDLEALAKAMPGFSGADLENVINEAALIAVRREKDAVEMDDLEEAREKVVWGRAKKSRVIDEETRKAMAWHEAGHALVSWLLPKANNPHTITIIPRGSSMGATHFLPEKEIYLQSKMQAEAQIAVACAGRVGEFIGTDDITTGAKGDIEMATKLARKMVCEWGMSDRLGWIKLQEGEETVFLGREITRHDPHSAKTHELIDEEIRAVMEKGKATATDLLEKHREKLELLANTLLAEKTLYFKEFKELMTA